MGIRSRRKTKHQKTEGSIGGEELISKLPDDILIQVLSRLAPQEVIRCGVLSRRWAALPKLVPMTLKFIRMFEKMSRLEETEFTHSVNQVLNSYTGDTLTELNISFPWCKQDNRSQLDKWVHFAMAKNVRKFSLDLRGFMGSYSPKYRFPHILYDKNGLISLDVGLRWCTSLMDLRLESVKVTSKQIKQILECCPFLESLSIIHSNRLTSLNVDGPIRLKFLEIQNCNELQVFEISAPNLISFKYMQHSMKIMPLKSAPQLNELSLCYDFLTDNFHLFTSYFDQIVTLSLVVEEPPFKFKNPGFRWPIGIPTLSNLKNLTICATRVYSESLLSFTSWIEASPLLIRFVFERRGYPSYQKREAAKTRMCPHHLLKEVEFVGFRGDIMDTELVTYIMENAVNLDKMVFDCRNPDSKKDTPSDETESKQRSIAIYGAKRFKSMLSSRVKFVLLPLGE